MCVCIYIYIHTCRSARETPDVYNRLSIHICVYLCIHIYINNIYIYIYIYMYIGSPPAEGDAELEGEAHKSETPDVDSFVFFFF